jgi:hypothetical protein
VLSTESGNTPAQIESPVLAPNSDDTTKQVETAVPPSESNNTTKQAANSAQLSGSNDSTKEATAPHAGAVVNSFGTPLPTDLLTNPAYHPDGSQTYEPDHSLDAVSDLPPYIGIQRTWDMIKNAMRHPAYVKVVACFLAFEEHRPKAGVRSVSFYPEFLCTCLLCSLEFAETFSPRSYRPMAA